MTQDATELARTLEGLNKHLQFAAQAVEDGWNSRSDRQRGFHMQAALATIGNVVRENEHLIDQAWTAAKPKKGAA